MARSALTKRAREVIIEKFKTSPKMSKQELMDEIRPHYIPDIKKLIDQDLGRIANRLAASVRDQNGQREIFAIQEDHERKLIYVDKSQSLSDVRRVYNSLVTAKKGLNPSIKKVYQKGMELAGQQRFEFIYANDSV